LKDIVVLTFYNAQRRRILNALLDMGKEMGLDKGALDDCLHTVDSFQGREAKYVILDTTVCNYRGDDSLGHGKSPFSQARILGLIL
jgi:superfamily I DNA and/or RNA helicase